MRQHNLASLFCVLIAGFIHATPSPLFSRGYTVIPEPRQVTLQPADFDFASGWSVDLGPGVAANSVAIEELRSRLGVTSSSGGAHVIRLEIAPGSVAPGPAQDRDAAAIAEQSYRL